jgi:hypothetical protein
LQRVVTTGSDKTLVSGGVTHPLISPEAVRVRFEAPFREHQLPLLAYSVESAPGEAWRSWKSCEGERD